MQKNSPVLINIGQGLSMLVGLLSFPTWTTTERPKNAKPGTIGFNTETSNLEFWDGKSWWAAAMSKN